MFLNMYLNGLLTLEHKQELFFTQYNNLGQIKS